MNRLAKKSLTASVLLTMILSLMPAINARGGRRIHGNGNSE